MKKLNELTLCVLATACLLSACSDTDSAGAFEADSARETALSPVTGDFVDKTVLAVYSPLADAAIELSDLCIRIEESVRANASTDLGDGTLGTQTRALVADACDAWYDARAYWELSEAFLYGAAGDYNIDPHIDSWPLNATELQALLDDDLRMEKMDADYAGEFLGYGLLGFHAVEYMIFDREVSQTALEGDPRSDAFTRIEELVYLTAVAGDLANQCVRLEAAWAGIDNVSAVKRTMLEEAELEPTFDYGASMRNAGQGGSKYKSYLEAAQEILQGCSDIADEVANQKIGRPNTGTSSEDLSYIESPYAKNSRMDFYNNIVSIRMAYEGADDRAASVGDYLATVDAEADNAVRTAIAATIEAIESAPAPFVNYAGSNNSAWAKATDECNKLKRALDAAQSAIGQ